MISSNASRFSLGVLFALLLALGVSACGATTNSAASIELTKPADGDIILESDDVDTSTAGLQYDVTATSTGVASGTVVLLVIEGQTSAQTSTVGDGGAILFSNATLPPGTHKIYVTTATGSVSSKQDHSYTYKALVITSPTDGSALTVDKDSDPKTDGFQTDVSVQAYAIDPSESVTLLVDDKAAGTPAMPDAMGNVVFPNITLTAGSHKLQAEAAATKSAVATVTVADTCATVTFVQPAMPTGPTTNITLGGPDSCPAQGKSFTTTVQISTDAGDGRPVDLKVNGTTVATTKIKGSLATFDKVVLSRRTSANTLAVIVQGAHGVTCKDVAFPAGLLIDCAGPTCTLASPNPVSGVDANGDPALYANASLLASSGGFDFVVDSDALALGQKVQLVLDGDTRHAKTAAPVKSGSAVAAKFANVALAEGAHTIEALCTDPAGNVTSSGEASWIVDTKSCGVAISSPAAAYQFVPADDTDNSSVNGVQVDVTSTLAGGDCVQSRAQPCDPTKGITSGAFATHAATSPLVSSVTLQGVASQTLCVEVKDRAGNQSSDSVAVAYLVRPPSVQIESPADGTKYNVLGGTGYTQSTGTGGVCGADFTVLCSEIGYDVDLRRDTATGASFASAKCVAPQPSDPALPAGFTGRATISAAPFLLGSATTGTLVATQTLTGSSTKAFVGESDPLTLTGVCAPPSIALMPDPCQGGQINLNGTTITSDVAAVVTGVGVTTAMVNVSNTDGTTHSDSQPVSGTAVSFTGLDFGGVGTVTVTVTAVDSFGNAGTASCPADIVKDLPALTLTAPLDAQSFGIGHGCNTGIAGSYGVAVAGSVDKATGRTASVSVDGGADQALTLTGAAVAGCIPLADGSHTLAFHTQSTVTSATQTLTIQVNVDTLSITSPTPKQGFGTANTCSTGTGGETGITVTAVADPVHNGRRVSLQAGTNRTVSKTVTSGAFTACIPASEGDNTLTVSILNASNAPIVTKSVVFSLVTQTAPTTGIPITTVTLPANAATYRADKVTLAWATPTQTNTTKLKTYALRCANTALDVTTGTQVQWDAWWTNATVMTLPSGLVPPTTSAAVKFRIGEVRHCELRAADAIGQLTPLVNSKQVNYAFRQHLVTPTSTGQQVGISVAAIGDVDGDGVDDVLVAGLDEAELVFGSSTPWSGSAPNVVFQDDDQSSFGMAVTGLGDFNGDGRDDFAISYTSWTNPAGALALAGRIFVFYGRTARDWPSTIDLRTGCAADLCFDGAREGELFGWGVTSAGDFNHDGVSDLAAGAIYAPAYAAAGRVYVILGKAYEQGMTKPAGQKFWNLAVAVPGGTQLQGFVLSSDGTQAEQLGMAIGGVGNFDALAGDDLVVSAYGFNAVTDRIFFLSGRAYALAVDTGLKTLALADFGFISAGAPSGLPLDVATTKASLGRAIAVLGNVYDLPGAKRPGALDIAVSVRNSDHFVLYPGDNGFDPADKLLVNGASAATSFGASIASDYFAGRGTDLGDLDGDGKPELCAGEKVSSLTGSSPGQAFLWYSDVVQSKTTSHALSYTEGSPIAPPAGAGTGQRTVRYVGDLNGDGAPDMVVADPAANSNQGEATILY